jgi:two-component system CheB/CheR fusion protein
VWWIAPEQNNPESDGIFFLSGSAVSRGIAIARYRAHNMMAHRPFDNRTIQLLVVEDSEDILYIMKTELEWMGYVVHAARDGNAALELAKAHRPDVIISDIQMPGIDGFELIRRIRSTKELAKVPAIALTGFGMETDVKRALERGFTAHMTKPVEPDKLSDMIEKLIARAVRAGVRPAA